MYRRERAPTGAPRASRPSTMSTSLAGKNLGNYRICGRLGSGGVGQVWRAIDTTLGRTVAIKALRPELAGHSDLAQRFRAEAQTLGRLNHPNIATLHSLLEENGALYMVLEYVEGQTFAELLRLRGPLGLERAFDLFHPVVDGLAYAHQAGVVHRDIKPSNLMVDARGLVKVMDFGIARFAGDQRVTRTGHLVGTPEFMSPEQIRGEDPTVASDIYALGLLLFTLLTGRPPFQRAAEFDVLKAQVESPPPPVRELAPDVPAGIERVLERALAKDPAARHPDAPAFRDALIAAGAPDRTGGELPTWAGDTLPGLAPPDASAIDSEAPTIARAAGTASARSRVGRWQHAAVALLMLALSAGADLLHAAPADRERADATPPFAAEDPPAPIPTQATALLATARIDAPPTPKTAAHAPVAEHTSKRHDPPRPPKAEETGWVIRR